MKTASVHITVNGESATVPAGISVAAALASASVACFRRSVSGDARLPVCGMGVCFECRVTIDGTAHVRACMMPVRDGMQVQTDA